MGEGEDVCVWSGLVRKKLDAMAEGSKEASLCHFLGQVHVPPEPLLPLLSNGIHQFQRWMQRVDLSVIGEACKACGW